MFVGSYMRYLSLSAASLGGLAARMNHTSTYDVDMTK